MAPTNDPFRELLDLFDRLTGGRGANPRPTAESNDLDSAHHEAGHTLVAWYSPFVVKVESATIVAAGTVSGHVQCGFVDRDAAAVKYDTLTVTLAGLAGSLHLNKTVRGRHFTTDLMEARIHADTLAERFSEFRLKHLGRGVRPRFDVAPMYRVQPSLRTRAFLNDALEEGRTRLLQHQDQFARLVLELLRRKTLLHEDLQRILGPRPWAPR